MMDRRGRPLRWALGVMVLTGSVTLSAGALAAPGGQGKSQGQGLALGQGHGGAANTHKSGGGGGGNSHVNSSSNSSHVPNGVANGYVGSSSSGSVVVSAAPQANPNAGGGGGGGSSANRGNGPKGKTTICHATGSSKNPFVVITPANPGVQNGHAGHQDGRDVIPAPSGLPKGPHQTTGCAQSVTPVTPTTPPGQQGVLGAVKGGGKPGNQVAGEVTGGGNPSAAAAAAAGQQGELPFTGLAATALLSIGMVLLFGGWLVRSLGLREGPQGG